MKRITLINKSTGTMTAIMVPNEVIFKFKFNSAVSFGGSLPQYGIRKPSNFVLG